MDIWTEIRSLADEMDIKVVPMIGSHAMIVKSAGNYYDYFTGEKLDKEDFNENRYRDTEKN
mgnify:CR=1 FL=1